MTQGLARYHARSPRFILDTADDQIIRVAGPRQTPWEEGTEIRDVSLTGLAFTAPEDLCPILGEVIRIQFMMPGGQQTACHAVVTRVEGEREDVALVAVHFYKLEMPQRIALAQGLARRYRERVQPSDAALNEITPLHRLRSFSGMFLAIWLWTSLTLLTVMWGHDGFTQMLKLLWPSR